MLSMDNNFIVNIRYELWIGKYYSYSSILYFLNYFLFLNNTVPIKADIIPKIKDIPELAEEPVLGNLLISELVVSELLVSELLVSSLFVVELFSLLFIGGVTTLFVSTIFNLTKLVISVPSANPTPIL